MYSKTIDNVDRTTDLLNLHCDLNLSNFLVAVTLLVLRRTDLYIIFNTKPPFFRVLSIVSAQERSVVMSGEVAFQTN